MSSKKSLFIIVAVVVLAAFLSIYVVKQLLLGERISGVVHYTPGSCATAGVGCLESYLTIDDSIRSCSLSDNYAKQHNGKHVSIRGYIRQDDVIPVCVIVMN